MYVCIIYIYIYICQMWVFPANVWSKMHVWIGVFVFFGGVEGGGMYKGYVSTMFCRCIFLDDKDVAGVCIVCIGGQTFILT